MWAMDKEIKKVQVIITCICSWQVELRPGEPWSAAVTVKAYSARSDHLSGEAALSSPVVGLREKRSALGPSENTDIRFCLGLLYLCCHQSN